MNNEPRRRGRVTRVAHVEVHVPFEDATTWGQAKSLKANTEQFSPEPARVMRITRRTRGDELLHAACASRSWTGTIFHRPAHVDLDGVVRRASTRPGARSVQQVLHQREVRVDLLGTDSFALEESRSASRDRCAVTQLIFDALVIGDTRNQPLHFTTAPNGASQSQELRGSPMSFTP